MKNNELEKCIKKGSKCLSSLYMENNDAHALHTSQTMQHNDDAL